MSEYIDWAILSEEQRNQLVAEKVMGWKPVQCSDEKGDVELGEFGDHTCRTCGAYAWYGDTLIHGIIPPDAEYSSSIRAVWMMAKSQEELVTLAYHPARTGDDSSRSAYYSCEVGEEDLYYGMYHPSRAYADSAVDAMCIAYLRHAGIKVCNSTKEQLTAYQVTFEDDTHMIYQEQKQAQQEYNQRVQYLKDNLQWAMQIRKLRMEEVQVPEDYFNGGIGIA